MSWKISKVYTHEWPDFKPHLIRLWNSLFDFPLDKSDWYIYLVRIGHAVINVFFVEFFRSFAYTLGHLIWVIIILCIFL